jgi:hypothetical protein
MTGLATFSVVSLVWQFLARRFSRTDSAEKVN